MNKFLLSIALPIARWALAMLNRRLVQNLPDGQTKTDLNVLFSRVDELITKMTDDNPDNAAQLDEIWREILAQDLTLSATARIQTLIAGMEDERLANTILFLSRPGIDVLGLLADDNPDDLEQIKTRFVNFGRNPEVHDLVLYDWIEPTLLANGIPEFVVGVLLEAIADALAGALSSGAQRLALLESPEQLAIVHHLRQRVKVLQNTAA